MDSELEGKKPAQRRHEEVVGTTVMNGKSPGEALGEEE